VKEGDVPLEKAKGSDSSGGLRKSDCAGRYGQLSCGGGGGFNVVEKV